jgi:hypothetical protein
VALALVRQAGYAKLLQEDLELKPKPARAAEVGRRQLD